MRSTKPQAVYYKGPEGKPNGEFVDGGHGWKVGFYCAENHSMQCFQLLFASERDAAIAAESIADVTDWNAPLDVIRERLREFGLENFKRRMVENLQW